MLLNLLLNDNFNYDRVYIYTINPQQDKYELLSEYNDKLRNELGVGDDTFLTKQPEELIPVDELNYSDCI